MNELYAVLLGSPEVYWNGKRLFFPFSKAEALLYYLLVRKHSSREELAALLWQDKEEVAARKNLRNTLYLLRKLTAEELVVTPSRAKVLLNTDAVSITTDIQEFNEVSQEESLVLYRGDFLAGFACKDADSFEDWVNRQRDSFKANIIDRLTKVIVSRLNNKDYSAAERYLKQLLLLDEYNESACRTLMKLYERSGAFAKAIEFYDCLAGKLSSELAISPQGKTQEVYERVRSKLVSRVAVVPAEQSAESFFGRERELTWLRNRVTDFCAERSPCACVILSGEQGVGKTMIVQRMQEMMAAENVTVLRTQCYQAELDYPYKAWNSIICQVMELLTQRGELLPAIWYQVIAYVFPAVLNNPAMAGRNQAVSGYAIHSGIIEEVMCGIIEKIAAQRKVLLFMDDIQWLDHQGRSVLRQLLRTARRTILCIATCRSEYQDQVDLLAGDFSQNDLVEQLTVENFSRAEVIRFSELMLPADKITTGLQQKLYEYTEGNALFLVESCKLIKMGQNVNCLSPRLRSVLQERVNVLSDNARKVLDVTSAFFSNVGYNELLAVCGMNEFEIVEAIEELQHKRLIQEINDSRLGLRAPVYKYSHIRIRSYVYEQLSSSRKTLIHKRAGSYLEELMDKDSFGRDVYSEILYHYSQINEKSKVLEYTIKLAEKYCCPQYELFPDLSRTYSGFVFENKLQIMGYLDKIKDLLAALAAEQMPWERLNQFQAAYLEMLGRYHIWRGDHHSGLKAIHQLLRLAAKKGFADYFIKGCQQVVYCAIQIRRPRLIELFANKLLNTANEANLEEKKAVMQRFMGIAYALRQEKELAEQYYRQSISQYKRLSERPDEFSLHIAAGYNYIGDLRRMAANLPEALYYYEQAIRVAGRGIGSAGVAIFLVNAGYTAYDLREYSKAAAYLEAARAIEGQLGEYQGYWCLRSYCTLHCILALLAIRDNCLQQGRRYLEKAADFSEKYHDAYQAGIIFRTKLEVRIQMQQDSLIQAAFADYINLSCEEYYRQGSELFSKIGNTVEQNMLDSIYAAANKQ
ncbi:AAA family ATPase [Sporomusa sp. KB1]|jgi:DNA-binding SARP family transcriptional activator|uniref:AAA family ATPase n=1 Tax=Sporomusa sp. KB1 TaxID=943346 RepID=UPI0011A4C2B0|nr:AAA family ATPase [Sporomusa sp. KB1]TWH46885.1 DNA-binding SARP family transcriptional activator [Sporomusa sp. KB1]